MKAATLNYQFRTSLYVNGQGVRDPQVPLQSVPSLQVG